MKVWAISDLHAAVAQNRQWLDTLPPHEQDWLVLAGDVAERLVDIAEVFRLLRRKFKQLVWTPGNHELWTLPGGEDAHLRGQERYDALVDLCRQQGVLTPEDPYAAVLIEQDGRPPEEWMLAPVFAGYDYSFGPAGLSPEQARQWARETGIDCADEYLLHADPYPSREAWCAARCEMTERRLAQAAATHAGRIVLINHYPLLLELARLPAIPRFSIWCGTRRTEDWPWRFGAKVVVSGHLHIRHTRQIEGVRFEEVSLGYPRQWTRRHPSAAALRLVLPLSGGRDAHAAQSRA